MISIDFEIHWGVLERPLDGPYRANLEGVPASVRGTLELFEELGIAATWATVGLLFARSREEQRRFSPAVRPRYHGALPDPFAVAVGEGEGDDPLHYAPTLIAEIARTPRQELATHTFAHLYCLEPAEGLRDAFAADLAAARAIMRETAGVEPRSVVFPRNQHNPDFDEILLEHGIRCYRGSPASRMWRPRSQQQTGPLLRVLRLADAYLPLDGSHTVRWSDVPVGNGLCNVPASFLLRPGSAGMRAARIRRAIRRASRSGEILHLWWHPHNFGVRTAENLAVLRSLLEAFAEERAENGMESLTMAEVAERCGARD